jgi:hypothetical protein
MRDTGDVTTTRLDAPDLPRLVRSLSCSAKGCRREAHWGLRWNNPRLHTPERRKTWLACDEHRTTLGEFLSIRGFLRETVPLDELSASDMA